MVLRLVVGGGSRSDRLAVASLLAGVLDQKRISQSAAPQTAITVVGEPTALSSQASDASSAVKELDGADIVVWVASMLDLEADTFVLRTFKTALEASSADEIPPLLVPVFIGGATNEARSLEAEPIARALSAALDVPFIGTVNVDQIDVAPPDVLAPVANVIADKLEQARRVSTLRRISEAKRSGSWRNTARQAWRAAGSLTRAVTRRPRR